LPVLQLPDHRSFRCETASHPNDLPDYQILTVHYAGAEKLARSLCESSAMALHYGGVNIQWLPRADLTAKHIVEERFDLFWSRDQRVQGLVPRFNQYYESIFELPHYQVLWFSRQEIPSLTPEYFYQRSIGLLEDMESYSHFLMPLNQLKTLGVDVSRLKITYFPNYYLLQQAFWNGDVDLISDGAWLQSNAGDRSLYSQLIDDHAAMGRWYVRRNRPDGIDCDLLQGLQNYSGQLQSISEGSLSAQASPSAKEPVAAETCK
ncbi:hypothetical protein, partial [Pseudomaricurvus sp.]|uniref:hypothetical protein n=1 Tax=Pseudomaricurvus sp. TaxID=2004510 RepID=UPI003F6D3B5A